MALKMPTRAPVGFKPYIFFFHGRWHAGLSWMMSDKHQNAALAFVNRLNGSIYDQVKP